MRGPAHLLQAILAILTEHGGPGILHDEYDEHSVFLAINEDAAYQHLLDKRDGRSLPPRTPNPCRSSFPSLLKVCPGRDALDPPGPVTPEQTGSHDDDHPQTTQDEREANASSAASGLSDFGDPPEEEQAAWLGLDPVEARPEDVAGDGGAPNDGVAYIHTATNRNRGKMRERRKRRTEEQGREAALARRRQRLKSSRLVDDNDDEQDNNGRANPKDTAMPPVLSWAQRQRMSDGTARLARLVETHSSDSVRLVSRALRSMLTSKALAVAGPEALDDLRRFYTYWRTRGPTQPRRLAKPAPAMLTGSGDSEMPTALAAFRAAWDTVAHGEFLMAIKLFERRNSYADLYVAYRHAAQMLWGTKPAAGPGVSPQTMAKLALFRTAFPSYAHVTDVRAEPQAQKDYIRFGRILEYSSRWHTIRDALGPGIFAFMPESIIANRFVEQTLTKPLLLVWIELIRQVRPEAEPLSAAVSLDVDRFLRGEAAPDGRIRLEMASREDYEDPLPLLERVQEEAPRSQPERTDGVPGERWIEYTPSTQ